MQSEKTLTSRSEYITILQVQCSYIYKVNKHRIISSYSIVSACINKISI